MTEKVKPKCRLTTCIYDYPPPGMGYLPRTFSGNAGRCEGCPHSGGFDEDVDEDNRVIRAIEGADE